MTDSDKATDISNNGDFIQYPRLCRDLVFTPGSTVNLPHRLLHWTDGGRRADRPYTCSLCFQSFASVETAAGEDCRNAHSLKVGPAGEVQCVKCNSMPKGYKPSLVARYENPIIYACRKGAHRKE